MWATYNGKPTFEIVERDDGNISLSRGPGVYFTNYEEWPAIEKKAMVYVKGRVLDIGCGAGRHSLYLQEKGFDILGIDSSPLAIKICKLRGLKKAETLSIEEVTPDLGTFSTILLLGNNFGLLGNPKKAQRLLQRFYKTTSKNALIIAETIDPYKTTNPVNLEYHEFNRKRGRMSGQLRIRIRFRKYATKWFDYLLASKEEIKQILIGTAWKVKEFLDSGDSYYIAIIEKNTRAREDEYEDEAAHDEQQQVRQESISDEPRQCFDYGFVDGLLEAPESDGCEEEGRHSDDEPLGHLPDFTRVPAHPKEK